MADVDISRQNNAKRNEYTDGKLLEKQKPGFTQLGNKSQNVQWLHEDKTKMDNKTKYKESKDEKDKMFTQKIKPVNLQIYSSKPVKSNDGTVQAVAFAGQDSKSDKLPEKANMGGSLDKTKYSSFAMTPKLNKTNKLFHVDENSSRTPVGEDDSDVQIKPLGQEIINKNKSIQLQGDNHDPDYLIGKKTVGLIIDDKNGFKLIDGDHNHQSADPYGANVHILSNVDTNPVNSVAKEVKVNKLQNETNKDDINHFSTAHVLGDKVNLSPAKVLEHINGKLLFKVASNASLSNKSDKNDETGKLLDKGNGKIISTDDPLRTVPVNQDGKDLQVTGTSNQPGKMKPDGRFQPGKELVAKSGGKQDLTGDNRDGTNGQSGNIPKKSIMLMNEKTIINIHKSPVSILIAVVVLAVAVLIIASVIKRKYCSRSKNSGYHQLPWDVDLEDIEMHPQYKIA
ncbi:hypothetical protein ACJMK2_011215 [Sinanodonta woodiana]|uniref:Uncharacterized protein n=1 Tax=Sinanodonta woodiana TaxID=1069815 RepID=A0ABD3V489_SINWO